MITVLVLAFFGGLLLSMPVVFALALGCAAALLWQGRLPGTIVPQQIIAAIDSAPLLAIPLFILFGELVSRGSLGTRLVALCEALVGWIRGGLAHANVLASIFFGGISGAATADTVAVGSVMIPEMKRRGYPAAFSAVVTCTSSVIGNLIPPSIDLIIFAWLTGTPVDRLFAAGLAPGVLIGFSLMAISYAICRRNGYGAPLGFSALLLGKRLGEAGPTLLLPLIILGGIFTGLFTVTESAAIAFVYGLALTFLVYRDLPLSAVGGLLRDSVISIGSIMFLLATAKVFGWILTVERVPQNLTAFLTTHMPSPELFSINVILVSLLAGCFLTPATALIILTPILHPIAMAMGFDPLHFGILLLSSLALGHVTPPVGLTLFIASGLSGEPLDRLRRPRLPFLRALIVAVLVIAYVPAVTLALPDMLWGTGR
jgi:tripartite ATP-independent transporter DctM subunit